MPASTAIKPELKYINLQDFSPGIRQKLLRQSGSAQFQSHPGAATLNTYRCIALPGGGLGPLPKQTYTYTPTPPANFVSVQNNKYFLSGVFLAGPLGGAASQGQRNFECHIGWEWFDTGGAPNPRRRFRWERHALFANPVVVDVIKDLTSTQANPSPGTRACFFDIIRMASGTDPTQLGSPLVAGAWYEEGGGGLKFVSVFPNNTTPNTTSLADVTTSLACDIIKSHQNRLIMMQQAALGHGTSGTWIENEQIFYTNVNLISIENSIAAVFNQDGVAGVGVVGSVTANEVLFIKFRDGAYSVSGSLDDPTVTKYPGIIGTKGATSYGCFGPTGFIYPVNRGGVYQWVGGDTSQSISEQLDDDFWQIPDASQWTNFSGRLAAWDDWVMVPNNFLYDTITNSWWKLDDNSSLQFFHYNVGMTDGFLYASPDQVTAGPTPVLYGYDKATPASSYRWQSQPFSQTIDRICEVRELVLVAQGSGTITVTLQGLATAGSPVSQVETFTVSDTARPTITRLVTSLESTHVQVQIDSTSGGAGPAPIVHELRLGYHESHQF